MTNYNDGKWHGWNGGECPLHPNTKVEAMEYWDHMIPEHHEESKASDLKWEGDAQYRVVVFRVVQEYKEPREFWLYRDTGGNFYVDNCKPSADWDEVIHVQEVVQD